MRHRHCSLWPVTMTLVNLAALKCRIPSLGIIFWTAISTTCAYAKDLTATDIRSARKVVLFLGEFDPPSSAAIKAARERTESSGVRVIVVPRGRALGRTILPFDLRLGLWEIAVGESTGILLPLKGVFHDLLAGRATVTPEFVKAIRLANPNVEIELMSDRVVDGAQLIRTPGIDSLTIVNDPDSRTVRSILQTNPSIYFADPDSQRAACAQIPTEERVCFELLRKGIYLGRHTPGSLRLVRASVAVIARRAGIYERAKSLVLKLSNTGHGEDWDPGSLPGLSGVTVIAKRGKGMTATGYLVKFDGNDYMLKVAHDSPVAKLGLKEAVDTSLWLERTGDFPAPKLISYDENGAWALYEYWNGLSLEEKLASPSYERGKAPLTPEQIASLRALYDRVLDLQRNSGFLMDFAPDNIFFQGDIAGLIDLGQTINPMILMDFDSLLARWLRTYQRRGQTGLGRRCLEYLTRFRTDRPELSETASGG